MEVTYLIIIALVTYILGAITKVKIDKIPNKYIPLQNVIIGVISAVICIVWKILLLLELVDSVGKLVPG